MSEGWDDRGYYSSSGTRETPLHSLQQLAIELLVNVFASTTNFSSFLTTVRRNYLSYHLFRKDDGVPGYHHEPLGSARTQVASRLLMLSARQTDKVASGTNGVGKVPAASSNWISSSVVDNPGCLPGGFTTCHFSRETANHLAAIQPGSPGTSLAFRVPGASNITVLSGSAGPSASSSSAEHLYYNPRRSHTSSAVSGYQPSLIAREHVPVDPRAPPRPPLLATREHWKGALLLHVYLLHELH